MRSLNIKTLIYLLFTLITLCNAMCYLPDDTCSLSKKQYVDKCLENCVDSLCDTFKLFYVEKCINKKIDNDEDIWHSIYIKSQNNQ